MSSVKILILVTILVVSLALSSQVLSSSTTNRFGIELTSFAQTANMTSNSTASSSASEPNSTNIPPQERYAFFLVLRLGNDTVSSYDYLPIHKVDNLAVSRHSELQKGMQSEDARIGKMESFCQAHSDYCHSLQPRPYTVPYGVWIDHSTVRSLLGDADLNFHTSPSLPSNFKETQIDIDGIVYSVGLQCHVEDCR